MFPFCKMEIIVVMTSQAYLVGKKKILCLGPGTEWASLHASCYHDDDDNDDAEKL